MIEGQGWGLLIMLGFVNVGLCFIVDALYHIADALKKGESDE